VRLTQKCAGFTQWKLEGNPRISLIDTESIWEF
jgi:hypothetical protein